jgi:F0F1-type ATP synthase assembly protein I
MGCFVRQVLKQFPSRNAVMDFNYKKNRAWAENLAIVMQLGLTMVGCICFCFFIGLYIDKWLGTRGIFVTIFTVLGVIGGANVAYRQILEVIKDKDSEDKSAKNGNG